MMKKYILSASFTFIFFLSFSQTNIYHPFPEKNAVWNYNYTRWGFDGLISEFYSIIIAGDTLIDHVTYKKLHIPFVLSITNDSSTNVSPGYKGAFRQDTVNKKVYFVDPSSNTERVLYDFNLEIGDTIHSPHGYDIVLDIDSILMGDTYRKRWIVNQAYHISIIEGLGSTYGLIVNYPGDYVGFPDYSLICFSKNNTTLYPSGSHDCEIITLCETYKKDAHWLSIYPNPTEGVVYVSANAKGIDATQINIRSLSGHLLYSESVNTKKTAIDISHLNDSIYLFEIISNEKTIIEKIILKK